MPRGGLADTLVLKGDGAVSTFIMTALKKACQVRLVLCTSQVNMRA